MKIINAPAWWTFTCGKCKAECQAEPADVKGEAHTDSDGDVVSYIPVVPCGRCGNLIKVPSEKLTPLIHQTADNNPLK